jgi:LmbE family N-acetylglucosaminyl deacetylase
MKHLFSPLLPKEPLQAPVLVLAAHPDDEVIGAGSMLAWHAQRGHRVLVVHATDGARGDPANRENDIRAVRRREGIEALRRLGIGAPRHWDLPDGDLPEHLAELTARITEVIREVQPKTLYAFHAGEGHRDHRAIAAAVAAAAGALPPDCRCLLFGVNHMPPGNILFDTTDLHAVKDHAARAYPSQSAYIDLPAMIDHRDRVATANIDLREVTHAEGYLDLLPAELADVHELHDRLRRRIQREDG